MRWFGDPSGFAISKSEVCNAHCKMKTFVQTIYYYTCTSIKADSGDAEPKEEICFSLAEGNMSEKSTKKIGDRSSSEDENFLTWTKKQKQLIEISDNSD